MRASSLAAACLCLLLASCVAPARTYGPYEADAQATAEEVLSASETALLAVETGAKENAPATYLSVILGEAEDDAGSAQGQFDSVQPPGPEADALRSELDALMDDAIKVLEELRILVRRGEVDRLTDVAAPLEETTKKLDAFATEHEK